MCEHFDYFVNRLQSIDRDSPLVHMNLAFLSLFPFLRTICRCAAIASSEAKTTNVDDVEVVPVIDDKPVTDGALVGDALSVITLKELSDDADPDRVVNRNSYRNLHRPDISSLGWVAQADSKQEVRWSYHYFLLI